MPIVDRKAVDVFSEDLIDYMIEVDRIRQLPDYKDGLKKVNRRIIYTMNNILPCMTKMVKSANIVGQTMGVFHPHGDSAIYDAMKPMTNWFEKQYPYIDGQGGFGTIFGDSASAPRYTEAELSDFAKDSLGLRNISKFHNITDWIPNYDNTDLEPEYLPAELPLLLIQGAFGIGVGIKTQLPPHNLGEVIDATIQLMHDPDSDIVLIPDQCMPGYIFNTDFALISKKGHGTVTFRGIIDIEKRNGRDALVIKSKPDMVYIETIKDKIEDELSKKEIQLADDIYEEDFVDDYGRKYSWYILELKKGSDPYYARDIIYKKTDMQNNVTISFESLDDECKPIRFSYKSYLLAFIQFRRLTKFRTYYGNIQYAETKLHEISAYIKALESGKIDEIIDKIRKRDDTDDTVLMEYLISLLDITDLQAKFIMDAGIKKLSRGYLDKFKADAIEYQKQIDFYTERVQNDEAMLADIEEELLQYKKKYNRPRNTVVIDAVEDTIPKGEFKIIVTNNNFIKKLPANIQGIGSLKGDSPKCVLKCDNTKDIIIFDEIGKVYRIPVHKIPISEKNSNGTDIRLINKYITSNIKTVIYLPLLEELANKIDPYYLVAVTANGNIKKMELMDFVSIPLSGIVCFKLDNDGIVDVKIVFDKFDIIVYSGEQVIRMLMSEVPLQKRNTKGLKAITSDKVVNGFGVVNPNTTHAIIITSNGKVNKINISAIPCTSRNKDSMKVIKLSRNDSIFAIHMCNEHDTLSITTSNEKYEFAVSEIADGSSISGGTKLVPLKADIILRSRIITNK